METDIERWADERAEEMERITRPWREKCEELQQALSAGRQDGKHPPYGRSVADKLRWLATYLETEEGQQAGAVVAATLRLIADSPELIDGDE